MRGLLGRFLQLGRRANTQVRAAPVALPDPVIGQMFNLSLGVSTAGLGLRYEARPELSDTTTYVEGMTGIYVVRAHNYQATPRVKAVAGGYFGTEMTWHEWRKSPPVAAGINSDEAAQIILRLERELAAQRSPRGQVLWQPDGLVGGAEGNISPARRLQPQTATLSV